MEAPPELMTYALRLLARRAYATARLKRKLVERGATGPEAGAVVERLEDLGLLRDDLVRDARLRSWIRRGFGPGVLMQKARAEGLVVDPKDVERAYAEVGTTEEEQVDALVKRKGRGGKLTQDTVRRAAAAAARKGLKTSKVFAAVRSAGGLVRERGRDEETPVT